MKIKYVTLDIDTNILSYSSVDRSLIEECLIDDMIEDFTTGCNWRIAHLPYKPSIADIQEIIRDEWDEVTWRYEEIYILEVPDLD